MASSDRIHLVVLFGGQSAEHDVSCTTAAHVLAAADPARYRVTPIGISTEGEWALAQGALDALEAGPQALPDRLDPSGPSLSPTPMLAEATSGTERTVVLPLLHGPMGEDGTVQGMLELANVAFVGSGVLGSALAMDKAMAKQVLTANGIPQARYRAFADHERTPGLPVRLADELGLPCFVKPANMGSSVGVTKARDVEQLRDAIEHALTYDEWVDRRGGRRRTRDRGRRARQHRAPSLPGRARSSPVTSSTATTTSTSPTALSCSCRRRCRRPRWTRCASSHCRCSGCCGVKGSPGSTSSTRKAGRGFLCNEVNTMPGFTPISMYPKLWLHSGMTYSELIDRLVELALERHARRRRNTKH